MNIPVYGTALDARIEAVASTLFRPNSTFRQITYNSSKYVVASIIILALSSFFFIGYSEDELNPELAVNELGFVLDFQHQAAYFGLSVMLNMATIVTIFYIGKRLGGSCNFSSVFSVLLYATIPVLVGGILVHLFVFYPPLLEGVTGIDAQSDEFPALIWPLYIIFLMFGVWSFVLSIKALKIVNGFGTAKSFGLIILATIIISIVDMGIGLLL